MPRVASASCSPLTQAPFTSHVACSMCSAVFSSSPWTCFCSGHHVCYLLVAGGFLLVFCFPRVSLNCFPSFSNPLGWRAFLTFYYLIFFFFYSFYSLDSTSHLPCGCYVSVTCISINSLLPASASSCKGPSSSLGSIPFYGDAFKLPMCLDNFGGKKPWCYRCEATTLLARTGIWLSSISTANRPLQFGEDLAQIGKKEPAGGT